MQRLQRAVSSIITVLFVVIAVSDVHAEDRATPEERDTSSAESEEKPVTTSPGRHSLSYGNVLLAQGNPMNFIDAAELEYRFRLYEDDSPVLANNYIGARLTPAISPFYTRLGGGLTVMPLSVARVGISYEWFNYFGTEPHLQSFAGPGVVWDEEALEDRAERGENYSASGTRLTVTLLLQGQIGPFAGRNTLQIFRTNMNLRGDDEIYYDLSLDTLAPGEGWGVENDADILYLTDIGLVMGFRHTTIHAYYDTDLLERNDNPNGPIQRAGPLVSYLVYEDRGAALDGVTIFGLAQWYIEHRFRTGADVSPVVPFAVLGVNLTGTLL